METAEDYIERIMKESGVTDDFLKEVARSFFQFGANYQKNKEKEKVMNISFMQDLNIQTRDLMLFGATKVNIIDVEGKIRTEDIDKIVAIKLIQK